MHDFLKKTIFRLAFLLLAKTASAQGKVIIDSSYNNNYYKHRVAFFRQMPDTKNEIIFLGNSLTEAGEWQELFPGKNVKNRGISGDVTYGLMARIGEVVSSKPQKIFILTGTNDLKRGIPVDTIIQSYQRLIALIKAASPKTKIYVQSVFPVNESIIPDAYKKITNQLVVELNRSIASLAKKMNLVYIDLYQLMKDENGQLKREYTTDGIHIWPDTYTIWANYLKQNNYL